jgi:hypothetical protein
MMDGSIKNDFLTNQQLLKIFLREKIAHIVYAGEI